MVEYGFAIRRLQVRISASATSHQGLLSLPFLRVGKGVPTGRTEALIAPSLADETQGVPVILCYPLTKRAIPARLRDASCRGAIQFYYLYLLSIPSIIDTTTVL